eukprot:13294011-Ditylum_brightwellii.AAC.1
MGVYTRLSRLTSHSDSTAGKLIDKLYPDHAIALNAANLMKDKLPTFEEIWKNQANDVATEEKKKKWKNNQSGNPTNPEETCSRTHLSCKQQTHNRQE